MVSRLNATVYVTPDRPAAPGFAIRSSPEAIAGSPVAALLADVRLCSSLDAGRDVKESRHHVSGEEDRRNREMKDALPPPVACSGGRADLR
jgi:hypothetical protein